MGAAAAAAVVAVVSKPVGRPHEIFPFYASFMIWKKKNRKGKGEIERKTHRACELGGKYT